MADDAAGEAGERRVLDPVGAAGADEVATAELGGGLEPRPVGLGGGEERAEVVDAEAAGHLLVGGDPCLAVALELQALEEEALLRAELAPGGAWQVSAGTRKSEARRTARSSSCSTSERSPRRRSRRTSVATGRPSIEPNAVSVSSAAA